MDVSRVSLGERIAAVSGLLLFIFMFFKWYGIEIDAAILTGDLDDLSAWEAFDLIDILLFLVAAIAVTEAVLRATGTAIPQLPWPPARIVMLAGVLAVLLILFRLFVSPIDEGDVAGVDVTRGIGIFLGLIAAAGIAYGGWRALNEVPRAAAAAPAATAPPVAPPPPPPATPAEPTTPAPQPPPPPPPPPPAAQPPAEPGPGPTTGPGPADPGAPPAVPPGGDRPPPA